MDVVSTGDATFVNADLTTINTNTVNVTSQILFDSYNSRSLSGDGLATPDMYAATVRCNNLRENNFKITNVWTPIRTSEAGFHLRSGGDPFHPGSLTWSFYSFANFHTFVTSDSEYNLRFTFDTINRDGNNTAHPSPSDSVMTLSGSGQLTLTGALVGTGATLGNTTTGGSIDVFTNGDDSTFLTVRNGAGPIGNPRWSVSIEGTETGVNNNGSQLVITRYNDAGAAIDTPVRIDRSSGDVFFTNDLSVTGLTNVNTINAINLRPQSLHTDRVNLVTMEAASNVERFMHFKSGSSPTTRAGAIFSNFANSNFWIANSGTVLRFTYQVGDPQSAVDLFVIQIDMFG